MNTPTDHQLLAIQAAKAHEWHTAIEHNLALLEENPEDIGAKIRLGVAYAQLDQIKEAKKAFTEVLELDKSNQLVKKHLEKLKNHQTISLSALPADEQFIEEPGKTKTVELHRLAGKDQLEQLSVGQICTLKPKNRFVSVEVGKTYVGSLPEDLSARLTKLMKGGNVYICYIRSVSHSSCSVFIKETVRSKEFEYVNSFPSSKSQITTINDMFLAEDNLELQREGDFVPPQIVVTDEDEEKRLDSFDVSNDSSNEEPTHDEPEN